MASRLNTTAFQGVTSTMLCRNIEGYYYLWDKQILGQVYCIPFEQQGFMQIDANSSCFKYKETSTGTDEGPSSWVCALEGDRNRNLHA